MKRKVMKTLKIKTIPGGVCAARGFKAPNRMAKEWNRRRKLDKRSIRSKRKNNNRISKWRHNICKVI